MIVEPDILPRAKGTLAQQGPMTTPGCAQLHSQRPSSVLAPADSKAERGQTDPEKDAHDDAGGVAGRLVHLLPEGSGGRRVVRVNE